MSTSVIVSSAIASEATFGNPDADGIPTTSGLTYNPQRFEAASITVIGGDYEVIPSGVAHSGPFPFPPEIAASWASGVRVNRQTGQVSWTQEVHGFGAGDGVLADANSLPIVLAWGSGMHVIDTGGARLTPAGAGANAGEVTFATGTGPAVGELVLATIDGCVVGNRVSGVTTASPNDTVVFNQYWPRNLTTADRVQRGMNIVVRQGLNTSVVGNSVSILVTCLDARFYAYGCRLLSATFTSTQGKLMCAIVLKAAIILPDAINVGGIAPSTAPRLKSPTCVLRSAALRITDQAGVSVDAQTAPSTLAAYESNFEQDGWALTITNTLADDGTGCGALGIAQTEVASTMVTFAYTARPPAAVHQYDLRDQITRTITQAAAPIQDNSTGSPNYANGWGFCIPSAHLTAAVNVVRGAEVTEQSFAWEAGDYQGDDPSAANQFVMYLGGT